MGVAIYDGQPFRLDPGSVQGSFSVKTHVEYTIGGKVVQVYGTQWGDLTVSGSFGRGAYFDGTRDPRRDQLQFLARMKEIADRQARLLNQDQPQQFLWPDKGWNFQVYLKAYRSSDGPMSVNNSLDVIAPKWTLVFFVVKDSGNLVAQMSDDFIARLSKGLGWHQTEYNGPMTDALFKGQAAGAQQITIDHPVVLTTGAGA